jgi:chromosome segregation ATPase
MLASTAPVVVGKRAGKRPAWDLKGQLCDLNEELKRYREKTETLELENRGLREQLREVQEQATTLGTERNTLEGELASVRSRAEQDQQRLETLSARVLELEECLGTRERLLQELQGERLQLQEERSTLSTQLEEQEVRPAAQVTLPSRGHDLSGSPEASEGLCSLCSRVSTGPEQLLTLLPSPSRLPSPSLFPCV